jgi:hypothetical protein
MTEHPSELQAAIAAENRALAAHRLARTETDTINGRALDEIRAALTDLAELWHERIAGAGDEHARAAAALEEIKTQQAAIAGRQAEARAAIGALKEEHATAAVEATAAGAGAAAARRVEDIGAAIERQHRAERAYAGAAEKIAAERERRETEVAVKADQAAEASDQLAAVLTAAKLVDVHVGLKSVIDDLVEVENLQLNLAAGRSAAVARRAPRIVVEASSDWRSQVVDEWARRNKAPPWDFASWDDRRLYGELQALGVVLKGTLRQQLLGEWWARRVSVPEDFQKPVFDPQTGEPTGEIRPLWDEPHMADVLRTIRESDARAAMPLPDPRGLLAELIGFGNDAPIRAAAEQERQPNLSFGRFCRLTGSSPRRGHGGFRQQIKRLAESGDHVAILPGAVR